MSGRRLNPQPTATAPVTELIDPALAQPYIAPAPPPSPELLAAQQQLAAAAQGISVEELQALGNDPEPFASFHPPEGQEAPVEEEVTDLTDEERGHFISLMGVGRRSKTVDVYGHSVQIESLTVGDDLKIGLFCKEYKGAPPADSRAFQIAVCACGLRSVDNRPLYQALSDDEDVFTAKANKLLTWYPPVVTEVYRAIVDLDREFGELAEKLKKIERLGLFDELEIRLAHEQGLLSHSNLNHFQHWALLYWIYMDRRQRVEDIQAELMQQTFNLFPERWTELYRDEVFGYSPPQDEEILVTEDDLHEMDSFLAQQEQGALKRWARAGALPNDFELDTQGVRV